MANSFKTELLSPVADFAMCEAAVQNGADAIYVGVPNFNARRHGTSITIEELKKIVLYCRLYDVKVYFACNILILESELENFAESAMPWLELCPDAVILQDIGLAKWFRAAVPWLPIHASTQITTASSDAVKLAKEIGFSRCVLARELSIEQIKEIHEHCPDMELEVFVHGALCVSYSGQCNASLLFGGRSANRGDCAQCCRLPYKIFANGKFIEKNYALSTSDLCALPVLNSIIESGVCSLKIEGRLKSLKYCARVTSAYRNALDKNEFTEQKQIETVFSRGFTTGWLKQENKQFVVSGHSKGHVGFLLGKVEKATKNKIRIKYSGKEIVKNGDGITIINEKNNERFGGRVYNTEQKDDCLCLVFARDKNFSKINSDFKVYINSSISNTKTNNKRSIPDFELSGNVGEFLELKMGDIKVKSDTILEERKTLNITPNMQNPYKDVAPNAFVNEKMIRQLKQKAIQIKTHRVFPGIKKIDTNFAFPKHKINTKGISVATPQVHRNSDIKILDSIVKSKPDFILVRSLGAFEYLKDKGIELHGDFSLNVCNSFTAKYFLENGMTCVRPSLDLSEKEILLLSKKLGSFLDVNSKFAKPLFHTKHCFFSAVFANNKIFPECKQPCKHNKLELEDHKGKRHVVTTDENCNNSIY